MARKDSAPEAKRRHYSDDERAKAVAEAGRIGVNAAAKVLGTHQTNVSRWVKQATRGTDPKVSNTGAELVLEAVAGEPPGNSEPSDTPPTPEAAPVAQAAESAKTTRPARALKGHSGGPRPAQERSGKAEPTTAKKRPPAKNYTPSQRANIIEDAERDGVTAASEKHDVSRFSIYDWRRKVKRAAGGEGSSPTSGPAPQDIEAQRDREILDEWHKNPGLGPSQIKNQLRRKNVKVSVHTARRVMEDAGYRPPKVTRKGHDERFEAVRPNHIWHLDFLQRHINRASTFTLILLDDCTRYATGHGVGDAERSDLVIETFEEAVGRHGRPEMVLHDRGAAFWSWRGISRFTGLLTEMGIDQIAAEHKEWNGKLEVFNANIQKELFDVHRFYDLAEMRRRLASYLAWYNHQRTHHALGGLLVPADRYYGRAEEVLARIEAGAGRELGDGVDLRQRTLELFKVATQNGVPEVWLMGKKILDLSK